MKFCPECAAPQATQSVVTNVQDSVVAGDLNITNVVDSAGTCESCNAQNVKIMTCFEEGCSASFCEICHPYCMWIGSAERFDSKHLELEDPTGPFCPSCIEKLSLIADAEYEQEKIEKYQSNLKRAKQLHKMIQEYGEPGEIGDACKDIPSYQKIRELEKQLIELDEYIGSNPEPTWRTFVPFIACAWLVFLGGLLLLYMYVYTAFFGYPESEFHPLHQALVLLVLMFLSTWLCTILFKEKDEWHELNDSYEKRHLEKGFEVSEIKRELSELQVVHNKEVKQLENNHFEEYYDLENELEDIQFHIRDEDIFW